jgi:hypothetical protein
VTELDAGWLVTSASCARAGYLKAVRPREARNFFSKTMFTCFLYLKQMLRKDKKAGISSFFKYMKITN